MFCSSMRIITSRCWNECSSLILMMWVDDNLNYDDQFMLLMDLILMLMHVLMMCVIHLELLVLHVNNFDVYVADVHC